MMEKSENFCLGGCGVTTDRLSGYCSMCEPEEDATQYDVLAEREESGEE